MLGAMSGLFAIYPLNPDYSVMWGLGGYTKYITVSCFVAKNKSLPCQ